MRRWGVAHEGEGLWWTSIARNKHSVVLDLRTDEGSRPARRLATTADVVLENSGPGSSSSGASATTTWWATTPAS